ncbi:leucyl/phenylalanyl-tRNA--protein transferase [Entomospira entomophila]|uniref:Leucyl/phenylalanyl-tRNA--protein transferase n=1 Tax=Entomospira entomophila TaxID=2719988 RepID=A0A968KRW3_9SPIO|nr:leucyl/phenylalanyl-tRNA--protein transferase [Entomospira entomophilus]NIZ41173.1 leucyl/phenylalanyl-tRNA--protein transferase [Entomospira entomophilus]WDI35380.1 leucyl/phenylalanyl-tRNA--protein transferase [Entomospira entomophilus]
MISQIHSTTIDPHFTRDLHRRYFIPHSRGSSHPVVARGGLFSAGLLLSAYEQGIFPWGRDPLSGDLMWCYTNPRCVLYPESLCINKTSQKLIKKKPYRITLNENFTQIIKHCASQNRRNQGTSTWIDASFITAYSQLYELGYAHCVAVYENDSLIGGLYGILLGSIFFGESMFSLKSNASKLAFFHLVPFLQEAINLKLIDCQQTTPHFIQWGAQEISPDTFDETLQSYAHRHHPQASWRSIVLCE